MVVVVDVSSGGGVSSSWSFCSLWCLVVVVQVLPLLLRCAAPTIHRLGKQQLQQQQAA